MIMYGMLILWIMALNASALHMETQLSGLSVTYGRAVSLFFTLRWTRTVKRHWSRIIVLLRIFLMSKASRRI